MRFLIISHVVHKQVGDTFYAYGPYVKEMNLWLRYVDEVVIVAPKVENISPDPIDLAYIHPKIMVESVPEFNLLSGKSILFTIFSLPSIFQRVISQMAKADHIHLRCPGNMGLIGALAQLIFPRKKKTAKYAGNWDPESPQPLTYRWQRKILSSQFLTKNIQVLIYGKWGVPNKNLLDFFTASYSEQEKKTIVPRTLKEPLQLIFVGSLHQGKNPMISCLTVKSLLEKGVLSELHLYGEGPERKTIEEFIASQKLQKAIILHGNVTSEELKSAYQKSHFLVFASETEGWPKAVAEAMFWGCLPLTTKVSCVPYMIGNGERGDLVGKDVQEIGIRIGQYLQNREAYTQKAQLAIDWSRQFTLEKFESEIKKLILN
jgi:glycosyltransferase involved in cell wall biosynthesis